MTLTSPGSVPPVPFRAEPRTHAEPRRENRDRFTQKGLDMTLDADLSAPPGGKRRHSRLRKGALLLLPGVLVLSATVTSGPAHAAEAPVGLGTVTNYAV